MSLAQSAVRSSNDLKLFIEHATSIEHGTLHVVVGVLVWLLVAIVSRRSVASWLPWTVLLALILWNEAADLLVEHWPTRAMQYGEGLRDVLLTMFVPTLLMFCARLRPQLFARR